ncbi:PREDICTED: myeloid leukemia factor 1 isoform X1 [Sturnus vulgaris]|uniref:myeloid leukemia factor 1 isoform X1 n=1 Tax=Sturnus vulgaris TaxID=9172 RepID=UPI00071A025A|nr:PREDICTED: myeloid leukemia factor 1 isoform X1 [Sturnus vulgaris]
MFGGIGRCFEDDPFFRDPFAAHHEHMRQVMRSFSEPFGLRDPFLSLPEGQERATERRAEARGQHDSRVATRGPGRATSFSLMPFAGFGRGQDVDFGDPFSAMDRMMSNMRNSMLEMHRKFDDLSIQPSGGHSFSSSSMMTYSKVGDEPPKVFQASAQTRTAPGGIKETRRALKDSESGLEKIAIGHHIQDRAHVVKKSRNSRTGDEEMNQEFINLDESEAATFDEEWQKEIMKFRPCRSREAVENPRLRSIHYSPRESGSRREKPLGAPGSRMPRDSLETLSVKGTHVPLKGSKK